MFSREAATEADKMTGGRRSKPNVGCGGWIGDDIRLLVFLMISRLGLRCRKERDIQAEEAEKYVWGNPKHQQRLFLFMVL